jgi:stage V sporulation protein AD
VSNKIGKQSVLFTNPVSIVNTASVVGPKEGEGPLNRYFDVILEDVLNGGESWEQAESLIVEKTFNMAAKKAGLTLDDIDYIIAGDLLNQNTGSTFGIRELNRPFFGVFSACSAMGESMIIGSMLIDGGFGKNIIAGASSHFCAAEKQFRSPLNLGTQRPPTSTWTVTGCGAAVLSNKEKGPFVTGATVGKIVDMGIKDAFNMGAAMAPAAADTLLTHFNDFNITPDYYDLIITGDLGHVGRELVIELLKEQGIELKDNFTDCGIKIFDKEKQDTHSGGSGCACAAVTFAGYLYDKLKNLAFNRILLVPTGALLSPTTSQQGETIPGIAHAVRIENSR